MPTARRALGVGVVNSVLYAVGGEDGSNGSLATVEAYDPTTNTWTPKAPMPTGRSTPAVAVVDGILYAVGGFGQSCGGPCATLEAYDPTTDTWTTKAPMPTARAQLAAGVLNGVLYAVGGASGASVLSTVESYDPATDTWVPRASMPTARYELSAEVVNGVLYAIGGGNSGFSTVATVEAYDPTTDTWTTRAALSGTRCCIASGTVNGTVYTVGGYGDGGDPSGSLTTVEAYDPTNDTWTIKTAMPTARYHLAAGVVNEVVYAVGGLNSGGRVNTVEAFSPGEVKWSSSDQAVATIDQSGLARGLGLGTSSITASATALNGSATLTVQAVNALPIHALNKARVVYGITPDQSITIYGTHFAPGAQITVGPLSGVTVRGTVATPARPFVFTNKGQVAFYWPNTSLAPGTYDVQVTNPDGKSGILVGAFVVKAPQPVVSSVRPTPVTYGITPSTSVTVFGDNFVVGGQITVGALSGFTVAGSVASPSTPFVFVSRQQLKFYWPNAALVPGVYAVQVTNSAPSGGLAANPGGAFTVEAPLPKVAKVSPTPVKYGVTPSKEITIYGGNFVLGVRVTVGSLTGETVSGPRATAAAPFVFVNNREVKFYWENTSLLPGTYPVTVTNPAAGGGLAGTLVNGFVVRGEAPPPPSAISQTFSIRKRQITDPIFRNQYAVSLTGTNPTGGPLTFRIVRFPAHQDATQNMDMIPGRTYQFVDPSTGAMTQAAATTSSAVDFTTGTITVAPPGSPSVVIYTPNVCVADIFAQDSFDFVAVDSSGQVSSPATVTVNVNPNLVCNLF